VYSLPCTGAALLQRVLERGVVIAVAEVADKYKADPRQVRADCDAMLGDFEKKGMVYRRDRRPVKYRIRRPLAWLLMALFLPLVSGGVLSLRSRAWLMLAVARLSLALLRWTPTLEAWERFWRQPAKDGATDERAIAQAVDDAVRGAAARHWIRVECKERALCCWALARAAGLPAELIVGVQFFPFAGHCWCEAGPLTMSDDRTRIDLFRPVVRYS
ncbi:MAG: lasso peptide biosynthesis B2 protein, partial [Tepidisphaeraceae bacterium]